MHYERIETSLDRMIAYIVEVNRVMELYFLLYITRAKQELFASNVGLIFIYGENLQRRKKKLSLHMGETIGGFWLDVFQQGSWIKWFEDWFNKQPEENLGLVSLVQLENKKRKHIPMVDFCCLCSEENLQKVVDTLYVLGEKEGFILESGNSYHYYGCRVFNQRRWRNFIQQCQKYDIIGNDWPFYQLKDGFSCLRIATSVAKPHLPRVIAKIGDFEY